MAREMVDSGISWIGEIPADWEVMPNKYLMQKVKDICPKYHDEDILSLTMKGVIVRDLDAGGKMPSSFDGYQRIRKGNLLMCLFDIDVTPRCIGLIKNDGLTSPAYSQFVVKAIANANYYNYYYTYLDNDKLLLPLAKNLRHSLTEEQLGAIPTVVPPLPEQQKIAAFLDEKCAEIDSLIADIQREIDKLERLKRSVITEAVTKGLDKTAEMKDSGVEWIGEINHRYTLARLGIFTFVTKLSGFEYTDTMSKAIKYDEEIPIVRAQNVRMFKNDFDSISEFIDRKTSVLLNRCCLDKKCVIITFIGAGIGDVCIFDEDRRFHLAPNVAKIEVTKKDKLLEEYIMYYLGSNAGIGELYKITKASAQPSLSMETIRRITIILPPIKEQRQVVDFLDARCAEFDTILSEKQKQLEILQRLKKSVIYEYVTGKKEVK